MPLYCITARHSPLPRKRLVVEAADEDEAVEMFLEENKANAQTRKRVGPFLLAHIARWEAEGGLISVDVEYAAEGSVPDLPPQTTAPLKRKTPLSVGRTGRRPDVEPEKPQTPSRRLTQAERDFERERNRAHGTPDPEGPTPADGQERPAVEATQAVERKPARKGRRPTRAPEGGPGGVQVLGDDALPEGLGLDPLED